MSATKSLLAGLLAAGIYGVCALTSMALTRFDGGFAVFWMATAVLIPMLPLREVRAWPPVLIGAGLASIVVSGTVGLGWAAAPILAGANLAEAVIGVLAMRWAYRRFGTHASVRWVVTVYVAGGLLGPALSGLIAAAALAWTHHYSFASGWLQWTGAHGLGFLAIFPFAGLIARARARGEALIQNSRLLPSLAMVLLIAGIGFVCFDQTRLPLLFLPVMVMMYATLLCDLAVSAAGLLLLLLIAGAMTLAGHGPFTFVGPDRSLQFHFLQAYFACLALTTAPIAVLLEKRQRLFDDLAESEARYRVLADFSTDIIMVTNLAGRIRFVSPSITQLGDYQPEQMIGTSARQIIAPEYFSAVAEAYSTVVKDTDATANVEFLGITAGRHMRWFESHLRAIVKPDGTVDGVCSVIRDISHRKRREAELNAVALTDPLTQLPNRRAFEMFVQHGGTAGQVEGYVAMFDLDHFKQINDRFGHDCGDRVLKAFGRAARGVLRDDDVVARIGGEEFAVFLADATQAQAELICARLTRALAQEAAAEVPVKYRVTASVGLSPLDAPLDVVLKRADVALYVAKAAGRDQLSIAA